MPRKRKKTTRRKKKTTFFDRMKQGTASCFSLFVRVLPTLLIAALFGGLFFGVREVLYADSNLLIQKIEVSPVQALTTHRHRELENMTLGKNILKVDLKSVAQKLEENPQVQTAKIHRHLPGTLFVDVTTRTPVAFIHLSPNGAYGVISKDGMVLDVTSENNASLVTIEAYGLGIRKPSLGYQIRNRGLEEAIRFINAYWEHPIAKAESLSHVALDKSGALTITLGQGPDIRMGRRPASRFATLEKIMHLLEGEGRLQIDYIDLQFDNVIVKRK